MPIELKMPALSPTMEEGRSPNGWSRRATGRVGRPSRGDRDRQGDDGVRGGRRRHDRQDPGPGRHRRGEGRDGDRAPGRGRRGCRQGRRGAEGGEGAGEKEGGETGAGQPARPAPAPPPPPPPAPARPSRKPIPATGSRRARSPAGSPSSSGVDLGALQGSGPGGSHRQGGRRRRRPGKAPAAAPASAAAAPRRRRSMPATSRCPTIPHEVAKLSNMRKTIARRLTESKQQVPHIYLTVDISSTRF
jgi:pyruvate dehydrogenase E2 component (dihydrolipoamide acetyltransferase)